MLTLSNCVFISFKVVVLYNVLQERALKEGNYSSHSSSISQLLPVKGHEDYVQHEIKRYQEVLQQNFQEIMEKVI